MAPRYCPVGLNFTRPQALQLARNGFARLSGSKLGPHIVYLTDTQHRKLRGSGLRGYTLRLSPTQHAHNIRSRRGFWRGVTSGGAIDPSYFNSAGFHSLSNQAQNYARSMINAGLAAPDTREPWILRSTSRLGDLGGVGNVNLKSHKFMSEGEAWVNNLGGAAKHIPQALAFAAGDYGAGKDLVKGAFNDANSGLSGGKQDIVDGAKATKAYYDKRKGGKGLLPPRLPPRLAARMQREAYEAARSTQSQYDAMVAAKYKPSVQSQYDAMVAAKYKPSVQSQYDAMVAAKYGKGIRPRPYGYDNSRNDIYQ